eukprot:CAMPEP_0197251904 /NCGR_PEP_ID=MMETSP1429-20130617/59075_1 /TAXON_ID=49237 /ORGANISM="Chaetoceros  sp., Strain UNC1202" /LENGTH=141 /DNA_ID=CAMNT_0042714127 /DNA_START=274 /DNA_END=699 /DNA_ORIENTATION=+
MSSTSSRPSADEPVPVTNPAEQEHTKSFMGSPASTNAQVAALIAAHNLPPSSASTVISSIIRVFGKSCSIKDASNALRIKADCSMIRLSVVGLEVRLSPEDGAKGAVLTLTSSKALSDNSSLLLAQSMGPMAAQRTVVRPI